MDKRQIKTKNLILKAFTTLISSKSYNEITINDILIEANISRSTFYSHYKTKDELLKDISTSIFNHVFSHTLQEEKSHDFSKSSIFDYTHLITHIFYHLSDEKIMIKGILSSEGKDIFLKDIRTSLQEFASMSLKNNFIPNKGIPEDLHGYIIVEIFIDLICYWFNNDCRETPERMTEYFINSIK